MCYNTKISTLKTFIRGIFMKMNEKGRIEVNMEEAYLDDLENRLNATAYNRLLQAAREC